MSITKLKTHNIIDELEYLKSFNPKCYNKVIVYYNKISRNNFFSSLGEETIRQTLFLKFFNVFFEDTDFIIKHTMNEGDAGKFQQWKKNLLGVLKGFPDVNILSPNNKYAGMFLEFKAKKGVLDPEQIKIQGKLRRSGYYVITTNDLDHAIKETLAYMSTAVQIKKQKDRERENAV